jgi:hypothetical protein
MEFNPHDDQVIFVLLLVLLWRNGKALCQLSLRGHGSLVQSNLGLLLMMLISVVNRYLNLPLLQSVRFQHLMLFYFSSLFLSLLGGSILIIGEHNSQVN